jgi:hypothetical protein
MLKCRENGISFKLDDFGRENIEKLAYYIKRKIIIPV